MKTVKYIFLSLVAIVLFSCQDPVKSLTGSYSYKVSGTVDIHDREYLLPDEMGSMDLHRDSEDNLQLVFNQLGGGVYTADAKYQDGEIVLTDTLWRTIRVNLTPYDLAVTGRGDCLDETIVFYLRYNGFAMRSDSVLTGEDILMVCKKQK